MDKYQKRIKIVNKLIQITHITTTPHDGAA